MEKVKRIPQCVDEFRAEMAKVFGSPDFGAKDYRAYKMPSGHIYEVQIPRIRTSVCFGYSHQEKDMERAFALDERAKKDEAAFVRRNMERAEFMFDHSFLTDKNERAVWQPRYYAGGAVVAVYSADRIPATMLARCVDLSESDRAFLVAVLEQERAAFERRLRAYLKRYGLGKVKSWTYWRDE